MADSLIDRLRNTRVLSMRNQIALQEEAANEIERLRKMFVPQWFYADGYSSEDCNDSPAEVIEYLDLEPGKHVIQIDCAGPMPSIWCAVHVLTGAEKDALDSDDDQVVTEFDSKEAAEAAIAQEARAA
ncbi:MAG: hypothetical protein QM681_20410 [Novosphingobium sp.]